MFLVAGSTTLSRVQVLLGDGDDNTISGFVYHDRDRDGIKDKSEKGIKDVMVSYGIEVVLTDKKGRYALPAFDNMTVFITKPAQYEVPVDELNVPQFFIIINLKGRQ